jgi:hypothetical protein
MFARMTDTPLVDRYAQWPESSRMHTRVFSFYIEPVCSTSVLYLYTADGGVDEGVVRV